jgi:endonuclease YncB( thermonuclease family)
MKKLLNSLPLLVALLLLAYSCSRPFNNTTAQNPFPANASKSSQVWRVAQTKDAIHDGDTMRLTNGSQELKVRFCGIDAPELKQTGGNRIEGLSSIAPQQKQRSNLRKGFNNSIG